MADTIYIKYFKMWKCHQTLQPNAADEAVWCEKWKDTKKQIQNDFPIILLIGILSYVCAWGNFEKNIMTNLVGTKPYSDQLSVWGHFTAASTNQIRTSLLGQTSWHLLSATDQSCEMSNFIHRQQIEFKIWPQKRVICDWYIFATNPVNPGQSKSLSFGLLRSSSNWISS